MVMSFRTIVCHTSSVISKSAFRIATYFFNFMMAFAVVLWGTTVQVSKTWFSFVRANWRGRTQPTRSQRLRVWAASIFGYPFIFVAWRFSPGLFVYSTVMAAHDVAFGHFVYAGWWRAPLAGVVFCLNAGSWMMIPAHFAVAWLARWPTVLFLNSALLVHSFTGIMVFARFGVWSWRMPPPLPWRHWLAHVRMMWIPWFALQATMTSFSIIYSIILSRVWDEVFGLPREPWRREQVAHILRSPTVEAWNLFAQTSRWTFSFILGRIRWAHAWRWARLQDRITSFVRARSGRLGNMVSCPKCRRVRSPRDWPYYWNFRPDLYGDYCAVCERNAEFSWDIYATAMDHQDRINWATWRPWNAFTRLEASREVLRRHGVQELDDGEREFLAEEADVLPEQQAFDAIRRWEWDMDDLLRDARHRRARMERAMRIARRRPDTPIARSTAVMSIEFHHVESIAKMVYRFLEARTPYDYAALISDFRALFRPAQSTVEVMAELGQDAMDLLMAMADEFTKARSTADGDEEEFTMDAWAKLRRVAAIVFLEPLVLGFGLPMAPEFFQTYLKSAYPDRRDRFSFARELVASVVGFIKGVGKYLCGDKKAFSLSLDEYNQFIYDAEVLLAKRTGALEGARVVDIQATFTKLDSAWRKGVELQASVPRHVSNGLSTVVGKLVAAKAKLESEQLTRMPRVAAFGVGMVGGSGIGKSYMIRKLIERMFFHELGIPYDPRQIHSVIPGAKFNMEGVRPDTIGLTGDDPMQGPDDLDEGLPLSIFHRAVGDEPLQPTMAFDKEMFIMPAYALVISNFLDYRAGKNYKLRYVFERRFRQYVVELKPEWKGADGMLNQALAREAAVPDFWIFRRRTIILQRPEQPVDLRQPVGHFGDTVKYEMGPDLSLVQFLDELRLAFRAHRENHEEHLPSLSKPTDVCARCQLPWGVHAVGACQAEERPVAKSTMFEWVVAAPWYACVAVGAYHIGQALLDRVSRVGVWLWLVRQAATHSPPWLVEKACGHVLGLEVRLARDETRVGHVALMRAFLRERYGGEQPWRQWLYRPELWTAVLFSSVLAAYKMGRAKPVENPFNMVATSTGAGLSSDADLKTRWRWFEAKGVDRDVVLNRRFLGYPLRGSLWLFPYHALRNVHWMRELGAGNGDRTWVQVSEQNTYVLGLSDLAVVGLAKSPRRDVTDKLVTREQHFSQMEPRLHAACPISGHWTGVADLRTEAISASCAPKICGPWRCARGLDSAEGDCGSPLVGEDGLIYGFVVAGWQPRKESVVVALFREDVDRAEEMIKRSMMVPIARMRGDGTEWISRCEGASYQDLDARSLFNKIPEGHGVPIEVVGSLPGAYGCSWKTSMKPTPHASQARVALGLEKEYIPASGGVHFDEARGKYSYASVYLDQIRDSRSMGEAEFSKVSEAADLYSARFEEEMADVVEPLTLEQAIRGVRGTALKPFPLSTSRGFLRGPGSKRRDFEPSPTDEDPDCVRLVPEMQGHYDDLIARLGRGEFVPLAANIIPKMDEVLGQAKAKTMPARALNVCNFLFNLALRQFFGPVMIRVFAAYKKFRVYTGVNCFGPAWTELANALKALAAFVSADFKGHDKMQAAALLWAGPCRILLKFVRRYAEFNLTVCHGLLVALCFPLIHIRGDAAFLNGSNPTGNALTTLINSLLTLVLLIVTYIALTGRRDFFEQTETPVYGDDNIVAVTPEVAGVFDPPAITRCMRENGALFVNAHDKTKLPEWEPFEQLSFLKRSFVWDEGMGRYLPRLEWDSIGKMVTWYRPNPDLVMADQLEQNLQQAIREAFFHGVERHGIVYEFAKTLGVDCDQLTYDLLREKFMTDSYPVPW